MSVLLKAVALMPMLKRSYCITEDSTGGSLSFDDQQPGGEGLLHRQLHSSLSGAPSVVACRLLLFLTVKKG
jgi:hypothetical protein